MEEHDNPPQSADDLIRKIGYYNPKLDLPGYQYPPLELLPDTLRPLFSMAASEQTRHQMPLLLNGDDKPVFRELYHHPNVLLAGTIASGKTQFIYNQLICWLCAYHPAQLKFVICRSKPVDYNSIAKVERHFLAKVPGMDSPIAEDNQVGNAVSALVIECDARLNLFRKAKVKTIVDYNAKFIRRTLNPEEGHRYLPTIMLVMDDLNTFLNDETSDTLVRLTQQNLYTGIYLIAATSQIMARSISPQLRANFSVRLSMKLMSQNESRKILDRVGAEKLTPPGELLYEESGKLLKGMQPFIDYDTILHITEFIGGQRGYPSAMLLPTVIELDDPSDEFDIDDRDPMFEDAARLVVIHQQGSTSLIQRKLKLGYNRAGRIIDQLEAAGIVGPFDGAAAREVLFPDEYSLEQFLDGLNNGSNAESVTPKSETVKMKARRPSPTKRVNNKTTSFKTIKSNPVTATKFSKKVPPSKEDKRIANVIIWVIIIFVGFLVFLIGGWEGLLDWLK